MRMKHSSLAWAALSSELGEQEKADLVALLRAL
jgi:hypothetical protein